MTVCTLFSLTFFEQDKYCIRMRMRSQGFTLVELLVVVGVIGILATIAISLYTKSLDRARLTVAIDSMNSLRKVINIYTNDHPTYPQTLDLTNFTDQNGEAIIEAAMLSSLRKNIKSFDSYVYDPAGSFTLTVTASDSLNTVITVKPDKVSY